MKSQPLPQSFNGRIQGFLFVIGISLLCLLAGGVVIWQGQEESGLRLATMVFVGLWPLAVGLLLWMLSLPAGAPPMRPVGSNICSPSAEVTYQRP